MESPLPLPPLTRFDAVMWFLRVQLWLSVVALALSLIQPVGFIGLGLQSLVSWGLPILVLAAFPSVLASGVLGWSGRDPVNSGDLRFLVGRCVGLALFVGSLGRVVGYSLWLLYGLVSQLAGRGTVSLGLGGLGLGLAGSFVMVQIISTAVSFLLGFFLAFGPAIREGFRAR